MPEPRERNNVPDLCRHGLPRTPDVICVICQERENLIAAVDGVRKALDAPGPCEWKVLDARKILADLWVCTRDAGHFGACALRPRSHDQRESPQARLQRAIDDAYNVACEMSHDPRHALACVIEALEPLASPDRPVVVRRPPQTRTTFQTDYGTEEL